MRVDDWHWLLDRDDLAVIAYLEAENGYAEAMTAASTGLRERLYEQIKGRVLEDDLSAPARHGGWWYWSRTAEGSQDRIHCRLADPQRTLDAATALAEATAGAGEVILDENALAQGQEFLHLGVFALSQDQRLLAYGVEHDGYERYALRFRDLGTGLDLPDAVDDASYAAAWAADGETLFYTRQDAAMRPHEVWRHRLGRPADEDERVFHEPDERFFVSVGLTRSRRFVLIAIESKQTSEVRFIPASEPTAEPVAIVPGARASNTRPTTRSWPATMPGWYAATGRLPTAVAARLRRLSSSPPTAALRARSSGIVTMRRSPTSRRSPGTRSSPSEPRGSSGSGSSICRPVIGRVDQPEPVYATGGGLNAEFDTDVFRFASTSLVSPPSPSTTTSPPDRARS